MANYITKFKTQADYNTQKYKLDYPNTSYIEGTDEVVLVNAMPDDYALAWIDANGSVIDVSPCSATLTRPSSVRGDNVYGIRWGSCSNITAIGDGSSGVFEQMSNLTGTLEFPSTVTTLAKAAISFCSNLTIILHSGITTIGNGALFNVGNTEFIVPDTVTSIGETAFSSNYNMTTATIGTGCTSIGNIPFNWCSSMTSLTIKATTPPTVPSNFKLTNGRNNSTIQIYVPAASVDAYKAATGWSVFASQINAITE